MEYTFVNSASTELKKQFSVSLSPREAAAREDEIRAFLAVQAGVDYIASQHDSAAEKGDGELESRIANCMANQSADEVIMRENLSAALEPVVEEVSGLEEGSPFTCTVSIYVKPHVELSSYDPIELSIPAFSVSPEMIERNIQAAVEKRARYVDDDEVTEVSKTSEVVISLATNKCGMEVQPLTFSDIVYRIGSGLLPQDVDDQLLGMKPGQTKEFSFDVVSKNFLGLDVNETMDAVLSVARIVKKETPDVTDAWVRENIPGAHDVAGFRRSVEENVRARAWDDYSKLRQEAASAALAQRLPELDLPDKYYDYVRAGLLQNVSAALSHQGMSEEELYLAQGVTSSQFMVQMSARACEVLRQGLALDALASHVGLEVGEDDLDRAAAAIMPHDKRGARTMLEMNGRSYQLREMALRTKARTFLVEHFIVS